MADKLKRITLERLQLLEGSCKEEYIERKRGFFNDFLRNLRKNKLVCVCLFILLLIVIVSLCAPLASYDPDKVSIAEKYMGMSKVHWFGTDSLGRDYFTRALYGGRVSLSVGVFSMLAATIFGTLYGTISGYIGGKTDMIMMRLIDIFMSIPSFVLIVIINAYISATVSMIVMVIALFSWMSVARIVRAETISIKEREFVLASINLGASQGHIMWRHIIPNMTSQISVSASISIAQAILIESALSFLGFGVQLPISSWGSMLQTAQKDILTNPMLAVYPGLLILITVLGFNLLGDVLRETLEPKSVK